MPENLYKTWAKLAIFSSVLGLFSLGGRAFADPIPSPLHFKNGSFETMQISSPDCEEVFEGTNTYPVSHYLTGPSHLNSVVHFAGTTPAAFFSNLTLTGYFGYSNDFEIARKFSRNGFDYSLKASGNVTVQFFLMSIAVEKRITGSKDLLCSALGEFTAFR